MEIILGYLGCAISDDRENSVAEGVEKKPRAFWMVISEEWNEVGITIHRHRYHHDERKYEARFCKEHSTHTPPSCHNQGDESAK